MEETPLYNTAIIKSFTEYISNCHPWLDMMPILDYAGITIYQLEDEGHWLTQTQVDRFYEILAKTVGDPDLARKAGQYAPFSKAAGNVSQYILGFVTPSAAYTALSKYYPHATKGSSLETRKVGSNKVEVVAIQNPDVNEKPYQCENRLGTFEGIAKLFTNELARIEHTTCMHISGDRCIYKITWKTTPSFVWKRIANYSYLMCLISCLFLFFALPGGYSAITILSMILVVMGISLYQVHLEKDELATTFKNHGDTASNLLDEINARYNNAMLVQEIGQAASNLLDIDKLLKFTMETIGKRLDFDRGLIMLANKERTRLVYRVGYGYNPDEEALLKSTEFHLDNPKSRGPFIISFKQQKPFLINDFKDIEKEISERSREFVRKINVKSFICVPIVYEGRSEGIMAVDNHHSNRPLNQSDINLFLGIAPQLGISINNARSYELIREREQRFRALSENAPDIIYTLDVNGRFSYVNPAWGKILGYKKEDVIGTFFTDFIKKEDKERFIPALSVIRDNRQTIIDLYVSILHKDGSERLFYMSGAPDTDSKGNVIGVVGTLKDVTDLKNSETENVKLEEQYRQAQKMEAIGQLAGGVAHDFNNMLSIILGYSQIALMKIEPSGPLYTNIQEIMNAARRSAALVRQLLAFARKQIIAPKVLDINHAVADTLAMLRKLIGEDIDMLWMPAANLWSVKMDPAQIDQIVANLAVNARDSISGVGKITIETGKAEFDDSYCAQHPGSVPGHYAMLAVSDNGCGMDKEICAKIFDPFFTTKEVGKGTGMGLSTVYGIVKQNHGYIDVYSEPGKGSTFKIYLPRCKDGGMAIDEPHTHAKPLTGTETVLLVEDDEALLKMVKIMLEELSYTVLAAGSPGKAFKLAKEYASDIHLVLTDVVMPEMSGCDLLKRLRTLRPGIKYLFMSGYTTNAIAHHGVLDPGINFIQKPFSMKDLAAKVREVQGVR